MSPRHSRRATARHAAGTVRPEAPQVAPQTVAPEAAWDFQEQPKPAMPQGFHESAEPLVTQEVKLPQDASELYDTVAALANTGQVEHAFIGRELDGSSSQLYLDAPIATDTDPQTGVRQSLLGVIGRVHSTVMPRSSDEEPVTTYTTAAAVVLVEVPTGPNQTEAFLTITKPAARSGRVAEGRAAWRPDAVITRGEACKMELPTSRDGSWVSLQYDPVDPEQAWERPPHIKMSTTDGTATMLRANRGYAAHDHADALGAVWTAAPADLQQYAATPASQQTYPRQ